MKTEIKRIYFRNQYNLKAQIACCDNGQYCLTRYSYPRPLMNNEVVEQHMTDTISEAFAIMDSIYKDEFAMTECSYDEFMSAFEDDEDIDMSDFEDDEEEIFFTLEDAINAIAEHYGIERNEETGEYDLDDYAWTAGSYWSDGKWLTLGEVIKVLANIG